MPIDKAAVELLHHAAQPEPLTWLSYDGSKARLFSAARARVWLWPFVLVALTCWSVALAGAYVIVAVSSALREAAARCSRRIELRRAEATVSAARTARAAAIYDAECVFRRLDTARDSRIAQLHQKLVEVATPSYVGEAIARCDAVTLFEYGVSTPFGSSPLRELVATVESFGGMSYSGDVHYTGDVRKHVNKRPTLTRMVVGTALAGPAGLIVAGIGAQKKKTQMVDTREVHDTRQVHDDRQLFLVVEAPRLYCKLQFEPDRAAEIHGFAATLNNAARQQPVPIDEIRPVLLQGLNAKLAAEQDTSAIASARQEWERRQVDAGLLATVSSAEECVATLRRAASDHRSVEAAQ
jgi:hypothetical protein